MQPSKTLRQRLRKAVLLFSLLLFPITLNYFSPYLIIASTAEGIIGGSLLVFGLLFIFSLVLGRIWCGWACPAGAVSEACFSIQDKRVKGRHINWIKWAIWLPWISLILFSAIRAGGFHSVDFLYGTVGGISVAGDAERPIFYAYLMYYMVLLVFIVLSLAVGRRAGCHSICWMAPFMILGRKLRNLAAWPSLRLKANPNACVDCQACTRNCPMSLNVNGMVRAAKMESSECILCDMCVDSCHKDAIKYTFSSGK